MKKTILFSFIFCFLQFYSYGQYGEFDSAKTVEPFKLFDNLYYVGNDNTSAYLLTTSDGLILIDALYGNYTQEIPQSIRKLGFDPQKIKYILCTHGHFDHYEGADWLQKLTHAHIG